MVRPGTELGRIAQCAPIRSLIGKNDIMRYLGKISGKGVLQSNGRPIADAAYEIEAYRQNHGPVRASGELTISQVLSADLGSLARMQLLTETGETLELKRPNADIPPGRHINVEVLGNIDDVLGWGVS